MIEEFVSTCCATLKEREHFPMVIVCPLNPDLKSLSFGLLNEHSEEISPDFAKSLALSLAEIIQEEQFDLWKPSAK